MAQLGGIACASGSLAVGVKAGSWKGGTSWKQLYWVAQVVCYSVGFLHEGSEDRPASDTEICTQGWCAHT